MSKIWFSSKIGGQTLLLTWSFRCTILIVFANGGLNVSFKASCGHKNCHSERRILISCRHGCPKFWFGSKIGGQTPLLTWSFRCTILIAFANGGLNVSFRAFCGHKKCHSELWILIRCRRGWPKFWFASKIGGQYRVLTGRFVAICLLPLQMEASECRSSSYVAPKVLF